MVSAIHVQSPLSPILLANDVTPKKRGGRFCVFCVDCFFVQRFLSIRISTKPMTMIATIVSPASVWAGSLSDEMCCHMYFVQATA